MTRNVHYMRIDRQAQCARGAVAQVPGLRDTLRMVRALTSRHFIRSWRKHRGLTLEQLAERIGMTHQNLGKIERGKVPYNQALLELLAEELRCAPADLIMRDPSQPHPMWSIWDTLAPVQRDQVAAIAETIKRTGTKG